MNPPNQPTLPAIPAVMLQVITVPDFFNLMAETVTKSVIDAIKTPEDPTQRMSIKEVCMYHGIVPQTLRNWQAAGKLKRANSPDEETYFLRGEVIAVPRKGVHGKH